MTDTDDIQLFPSLTIKSSSLFWFFCLISPPWFHLHLYPPPPTLSLGQGGNLDASHHWSVGHCLWLPGGGSVGGTSSRLEGRRREIKAFLPGLLSSSTRSFWQCPYPSGTRGPTGQPIFGALVLNPVEDHGFLLLLSKTWRIMGLWVPQLPLWFPLFCTHFYK